MILYDHNALNQLHITIHSFPQFSHSIVNLDCLKTYVVAIFLRKGAFSLYIGNLNVLYV